MDKCSGGTTKEWSQDWIDSIRKCANQKWQMIEEGYGIDKKWENCELCLKCGASHGIHCDCVKCPIFWKTGKMECRSTPYTEWTSYFRNHMFYLGEMRVIDSFSKELASKEKNFLLNLADELEAPLKRKEKYFLQIENPSIAIGEGNIYVKIVGSDGSYVPSPYLVRLNKNRTLYAEYGVNKEAVEVDPKTGAVKLSR